MENFTAFAWTWISILVALQSAVFILASNIESPVWKSYLSAWVKTARILKNFFVVGSSDQERKDSLFAWTLLILSLPGAVLVRDALSKMAE